MPGPGDDLPEAEDPPSRGLTPVNLAAGLVLLAAVAGTGYWSFTRPPAAESQAPAARRGHTDRGFLPAPATNSPPILLAERGESEPARSDSSAPEPPRLPSVTPGEAPAPLEDVVGRILPAVVLVETPSGRGSGFYVRSDTLITNLHVVKTEGFVKVRRSDGTMITARVDLRSPAHDLAILRVATPAEGQVVIEMGRADTLRPGQEVINIGSPFGTLRNSVTRGVVSGIRRSGVATIIQNDAASHPGSSGGPLLDRNGVAIGVTTSGDSAKGINYAVAIDHARAILDGRLADSTAPPLTFRDVTTVDPAPREPQRVLGERAFAAAVTKMAATADAIDAEWKKFRQSCYTAALPESAGREWFVMLSPRPITPSQVSFGPCATFVTGMQGEAKRVRTAMRGALDSARRAGVLPGTIREALEANRLEFDWDR